MSLTLVSLITFIGLLRYYIIFSQVKISSVKSNPKAFNQPISIIICAKNELENIKLFFQFWINQDYADFELILVNDQSTDGSKEYLDKLSKKYEKLKIVHIATEQKKGLKGKRQALWEGIKATKHNYILLTDADCKPLSTQWLQHMTNAFKNDTIEIVLGYGAYKKDKSFLNKLIQYDTLLTALQYFGLAEKGMPYMSVGRNVAYKKSLLSRKVFEQSNQSISGDDDLVAQQLMHKKNTAYITHKNAWTESVPPKNLKSWFAQKTRHSTAGMFYKNNIKLILGSFISLNILGNICLIASAFVNGPLFLTLLGIKIIAFIFLLKIKHFLNENRLTDFVQYIFIDTLYWLFYIIFATKAMLKK